MLVNDLNPDTSRRVPSHNHLFLLEETMGLCTVLGIKYEKEKVYWATGAQYIVPAKDIKSKSVNWWINLHHLFDYYSKMKKIESWTYALERIWPLIWNHSDL